MHTYKYGDVHYPTKRYETMTAVRIIGAEYNSYDEQQEIWRVLLSAGYAPRVYVFSEGCHRAD